MKYSSAISHTSKPEHRGHDDRKTDAHRGSTNFFKELTSSLYDPKAAGLANSRHPAQVFLLSPGASSNLFVPSTAANVGRKVNAAAKSPSTASVEQLQQKIVTLKKKIS